MVKRTKKLALTLRKVQLQKLRDEISEVLGAQFGAIDTFSEEVFLLCEKARTMLPPRELREWLTKDVAALRKAEEILIRHMIGHVAIYVEAIGDKIQADASAEYCEMATDAKGTVSDLIASLEERLAGLEQLRVGRPSNDLKELYSRVVPETGPRPEWIF